MGKVINLNKFRKQKAKAAATQRADTNRRLHGRTKAERTRDEQEKRLLDAKVDGAKLEVAPNESEDGDDE
ncbi:MAG: hypothetical protein RL701_371 [Pseudomonadota bacterium]|jgi:hypothetical protein